MQTNVPLTPNGETTYTPNYFWIKLHHFASRMTPILTHSSNAFLQSLVKFLCEIGYFSKEFRPQRVKVSKNRRSSITTSNFKQFHQNSFDKC